MGCEMCKYEIKDSIQLKQIEVKTGSYKQIQKKYTLNSKILGSGNFGKVFLAHNMADPAFKVAIKTIPKHKLSSSIEQLKEEIKILSKLDHPNIIKYYETYESPKYLYVVMEYCSGGELFEKLAHNPEAFTEAFVRKIMYKLFLAVNHCH